MMSNHSKTKPKLWLVVSSFRNDSEIAATINCVHNLPQPIFDAILVVDSLGTNQIPELIKKCCWKNVIYKSYDYNLGSAGNLAERLRIAAANGADFAYALNHDGRLCIDVVTSLLSFARATPKIGACYPLGYMSGAGAYNLTGTLTIPFTSRLVKN